MYIRECDTILRSSQQRTTLQNAVTHTITLAIRDSLLQERNAVVSPEGSANSRASDPYPFAAIPHHVRSHLIEMNGDRYTEVEVFVAAIVHAPTGKQLGAGGTPRFSSHRFRQCVSCSGNELFMK